MFDPATVCRIQLEYSYLVLARIQLFSAHSLNRREWKTWVCGFFVCLDTAEGFNILADLFEWDEELQL